MTIHTLGIDIAKSTFQLHGAGTAGKAVLEKRLPRHKLAAYIANLPACTIVMGSCGGANDALAIVEAASRPSMSYVPLKQVE